MAPCLVCWCTVRSMNTGNSRRLSCSCGCNRPVIGRRRPTRSLVRFAAIAEWRSLLVLGRGPALRAGPQEQLPHGRPRRSPAGPERKRRSAPALDGRGRPCATGRRGSPGAHAPAGERPGERPYRRRIRTGAASRRISVRGSRGRSPPPARCSTSGRLAHGTQAAMSQP